MNEHERIEQEVLEAVMAGRWDSQWAEPLRAHARSCPSCSDLVLVAGALREEREAAEAQAKLPSAALVWWKAQLRARQEAAERSVRPVAIAEKASLAAAFIALVFALLVTWPAISGGFARVTEFAGRHYSGFFLALASGEMAVGLAIATGLLCLSGFALYTLFATSSKNS